MSHENGYSSIEERNKALLEKTPSGVPASARGALLAGTGLGIAGVVWGFIAHDSIMWGVLLVNFILLTGLTVGGPVAAAVVSTVSALWARPVKRMMEMTIGYWPYLFVILALLFVGADNIWEWTLDHHEIHLHGAKSVWLSKPFVFARAVIWIGILLVMTLTYVKKSVRPDAGLAQELDPAWGSRDANARMAEGFTTVEEEVEKAHGFLVYWSPWTAGLYAIAFAMLTYDLVMSVDPHWFSTMFGGWMFMQNIQIVMAFTGIVAFTAKARLGMEKTIQDNHHHDIGKLTFGTSIFWAYLGFSQYIVIWYGNLPEETMFLNLRSTGPWLPVFSAVVAMCFVLPFFLLVTKGAKLHAGIYRTAASLVIAGGWLNLYMLIIPSVLKLSAHHGHEVAIVPTITVPAILVTIGAISSFVLVYLRSLSKYPIAPISDPFFGLPEKHI